MIKKLGLIYLSLTAFIGSHSLIIAQVNVGDSLALVELYNATDGPNWTDNSNWLTGTVDTWFGITVFGSRVTRIDMLSNNMTGTIPPEIGDLDALTWLFVNGNNLGGDIPIEVYNLTNLVTFSLQANSFTGGIRPEIGNLVNLQLLYLIGNPLGGPIPLEVSTLTNLRVLGLASCELTGPIPPELGNLTNLQQLALDYNNLTGTIPPEIGNLSDLTLLGLSGNQLTGTIPIELWSLPLLEIMQITENQLTGSIPVEIDQLSNLKSLHLWGNQLSGDIPTEFGNLALLELVQLQENQFTSVPNNLTNLSNLTGFYIQDNLINDLPDLSGLTNLTALSVTANLLQFDDLEPNIGIAGIAYSPQNVVGIADTFLLNQGDTLTLSIPVGGSANQYQWQKDGVDIAGATSDFLEIPAVDNTDNGTYNLLITSSLVPGLVLSSANKVVNVVPAPVDRAALIALYNATDGPNWVNNTNWNTSAPIDTWYGVSVTDNRVTSLVLGDTDNNPPQIGNNLVGVLPPELGDLDSLNYITLAGNQISGTIPLELGNLLNLEFLLLYANQLTGSIPSELGNLTKLKWLYLDDNQITGSISAELGRLSALEILSLSQNQLSGSIPETIGGLGSLSNLWLHNNQLTGSIPGSIGNLSSLQQLLLSSNRLSGIIPVETGNLAALQYLFLQNNLLEGPVPDEINNLTNLLFLNIDNNNLDYLPLLDGLTALQQLSISNNKFTYSDMIPNMDLITANISQKPFGDTLNITGYTFEALRIDPQMEFVDGQVYEWLLDSVPLANGDTHYLDIDQVLEKDGGTYQLLVTHPDVPNLTLSRIPIFLNLDEGDPPMPQMVEVISINGDGINDEATIKNIEFYPDHRVLIYDVLGRLVYETNDYDNINNPFVGIGNVNGNKELPAGTYYYLIDVGDTKKNGTGFFVMKWR